MKTLLKTDQYQFEEGYCQAVRRNATQDSFTFLYYDRDHLGNIRQVTKDDGTQSGRVVQRMDYYPFGAQLCDGTKDGDYQPRRYNGKELDRMHGLNTYDYGARQYDPALARWDRVDPLCEKYYGISPYTYCGNNPMNCIDLHGDSITMDYKSMLAIYRGLKAGYNLNMDFHSGVLNPSSIAFQAKYSDDSFLQNLYEIAKNPQMVVLRVTDNNIYKMQGMLQEEKWNKPEDFDVEQSGWSDATISEAIRQGIPKGKTINGNLGQTLYPNKALKTSIGGTIEININSKGSPIHQTVGISHEFAHVVRFLKGLPHSHSDAGAFIYGCQWDVMKRFGYDYLDVNIFGVNYSK
jgi:RHS repeat-associated protein